jgi:hypothetical protein
VERGPLTELEAARAWALAYNTHDPSVLEPLLAADVRVMSRWVVSDLVGRTPYLAYLAEKFRTFERVGSHVRVEIGSTPGEAPGWAGRPCALLEQDRRLIATVLFDVIGGAIVQISLGANPDPAVCIGSGSYPGFDDDDQPVN